MYRSLPLIPEQKENSPMTPGMGLNRDKNGYYYPEFQRVKNVTTTTDPGIIFVHADFLTA
eukprot:753915-Hanusia_phi.AAC.30